MVDSQLTPLQIRLLEMMKWFHHFCVDNGLTYYVLCGTMLGAARHQGFIPWDDDVDVGLPRKDYQRLSQLMSSIDCGPYTIETPYSEAEEYCYSYSKIYDTSTTLIENKRKKVVRGVFLDVFPIDGLGNTEEECKANYEPINKKYNMHLFLSAGFRKGRKWYKNAAVFLGRCIPPCLINDKKVMIELDKLCASIDYENSSWICSDMGAWRIKEAMPKAVYGEAKLYKFESINVFGVAEYDEYLTHIYGNWRELPPEDKRVSHHDFVYLDLSKGYITK